MNNRIEMEMSLNEENPYNEIIEIKEFTNYFVSFFDSKVFRFTSVYDGTLLPDFQQILFILMLIILFLKIILEN